MTSRRQLRVAEQIHRELSLLLMFETRDPRLAGLTITGVTVTADLQLARVYYTVLGTAEEWKEVLAALEHAKGYLRTQVAQRIQLRFAPELVFHADHSAEYGQRIDEILDRLQEHEPPHGPESV
jgi:ribosome-binding factor A